MTVRRPFAAALLLVSTALAVTGVVAVTGVGGVGGVVHLPPAVADADPGAPQVRTTVQLIATLEVGDGAVLRDRDFVWAGPSDAPMLRLTGASFASLENLAFVVPAGHHATAAVELVNGPAGGPLGTRISNVRIGNPGADANLDYGLRWLGTVNGDSNTVTDVVVFAAAKAGVAIDNPQATGNSFRSLYVFHSPVGLHSSAGGTVSCDNCGFIGSSDVDVDLSGGAGLVLMGLYSEGSKSFARVGAGPGAAGLTVVGGYWQHGPAASGPTITGLNMCCYRSWLRLQDLTITPLDPGPHGTVSGVPADKRFLSNVAGLTPPV